MNFLPSYFFTRLVWLIFGLSIGILWMFEWFDTHEISKSLFGVSFALMGIAGFMHPVLFKSRFPPSTASIISQENAIGPQSVRTTVAYTMLVCLFIGILLKYVFHV